MKQTLHLTIPTPCHERWDSMTATDHGAYCHSCTKEVIDFTTMTDSEVIRWLKKHNTGCGRFRKDQLDRDMVLPVVHDSPLRWRVLLVSLLPAFSLAPMAVRALPPLTDQAAVRGKADTAIAKADPAPHTCDTILAGICGLVLDENGEGLIGATVQVLDANGIATGQGAAADYDGKFTIGLTPDDKVNLKVSIIGYATQILTQVPREHPFIIFRMRLDTVHHQLNIVTMGRPIVGLIDRERPADTAIAKADTIADTCDTTQPGICGRILDETGEGLIGGTVEVIDANGRTTGQGAAADIDGHFAFALRDSGTVTLRAKYVGYETQILTVRPYTHPYMIIRMKEDNSIRSNMVGMLVIQRTPAQKVKAWLRRGIYTLTHLLEYREYKLARQRVKD